MTFRTYHLLLHINKNISVIYRVFTSKASRLFETLHFKVLIAKPHVILKGSFSGIQTKPPFFNLGAKPYQLLKIRIIRFMQKIVLILEIKRY